MKIDLRRQDSRYEKNPFIFQLKDKMYLQPRANTIISRGQSIVDTETGEIINDSVLLGRRRIVDKSQFSKIYASEIGVLYELSKKGQNVFLFLIKNMDYDNKSFINAEYHKKELGYKTRFPINEAIKELINRAIVAPAIMPHYYWINPTIVCKGERFAVYTEYITGKDGEYVKNFGESELKRKGKLIGNLQPEIIQEKYQKASSQNPTDSQNKEVEIHQTYINFDTGNPYKD